jgi:hypothetical protein
LATFHAADLFVAVVPDTSKIGPSMEQAGKDAKDKFGTGVKGMGKSVTTEIDQVSTHAKDSFGKAGKDAGTSFGRELKTTVTQEVKGAFSGVASDLRSGNFASAIDGIKDKIGGISDIAKQVGIDVSGWVPSTEAVKAPLNDVDTKMADVLKGAGDTASVFSGMPGKVGEVASKIAGMATQIGLVVEGAHQLYEQFGRPLDIQINASGNLGEWLQHHTPGDLGKSLADSLGADRSRAWLGKTFGYDPEMGNGPKPEWWHGGSTGLEPYPEHFIGPIPKGAVRSPEGYAPATPAPAPGRSFYSDWYGGGGGEEPPAPESPPASRGGGSTRGSGGGGGGGGAGGGGRNVPTPSTRRGLHAAGSSIANLYAFANSLVGTPYSQDLRDDCSGMVAKLANVALGLPPVASFSTANEGDWLFSHGFEAGLGGPNDFNIGWHIGGPGGGHTAATLPGGVHAESGGSGGGFRLGGPVGAESSQFEQHAHLAMGGGGPSGTKDDPYYTADADPAGGGQDPKNQYAQTFGSSLVTGMLQAVGLDGSVLKGFAAHNVGSPLDWGATKLGTGFINLLLGGGKGGGAGGPGGAGGGGLGGLGALISGAASPAGNNNNGGDTHNYNGTFNGLTVNQTGNFPGSGMNDMSNAANSGAANRYAQLGLTAGLAAASGTG